MGSECVRIWYDGSYDSESVPTAIIQKILDITKPWLEKVGALR